MKPSEILRGAIAYIEEGWQPGARQGVEAAKLDGSWCNPHDSKARSWGLLGALSAASGNLNTHTSPQPEEYAAVRYMQNAVGLPNDGHGRNLVDWASQKAEVAFDIIFLLQDAAKLAEQESD